MPWCNSRFTLQRIMLSQKSPVLIGHEIMNAVAAGTAAGQNLRSQLVAVERRPVQGRLTPPVVASWAWA
jgi:hypothetical protein